MLRYCSSCSRPNHGVRGGLCPSCRRRSERARTRARAVAEPHRWVYLDPRWKRARAAALFWDGYRCVVVEDGIRCERRHSPPDDPLTVHHLVPLRVDPERAFDGDNLVSLCREHHAQVEAELRRL